MFAVIFEVQPKKERWTDYLDLAKYLIAGARRASTTVYRSRAGSKFSRITTCASAR